MKWEDWHVPDPKLGEVRIRHTAIGVNYADTYHRAGISHPWPVPEEPVVIGFEGVGIVEGIGKGVTDFKTGDRVAYGIPPLGSYSEFATILPTNCYICLKISMTRKLLLC
jgi:NADPH2:quinone reductase